MKILQIFIFSCLFFTSSCGFLQKAADISNISSEPKAQYVVGAADIPLYQGLNFIAEESSNFDTISGNIVSSKYIGDVKAKDVQNFYLKTLPQLGWKVDEKSIEKLMLKRNNDSLEIDFEYGSKGLYIKFFISLVSE
jgi:hypothetical protein